VDVTFPNWDELSLELNLKLINILMSIALGSSSIDLKYICLRIFPVSGFALRSFALVGILCNV
jgi:hypothetical protein